MGSGARVGFSALVSGCAQPPIHNLLNCFMNQISVLLSISPIPPERPEGFFGKGPPVCLLHRVSQLHQRCEGCANLHLGRIPHTGKMLGNLVSWPFLPHVFPSFFIGFTWRLCSDLPRIQGWPIRTRLPPVITICRFISNRPPVLTMCSTMIYSLRPLCLNDGLSN